MPPKTAAKKTAGRDITKPQIEIPTAGKINACNTSKFTLKYQ